MTKHQNSFHRSSAVAVLCMSVFLFCVMIYAGLRPKNVQQVEQAAGVSGFAVAVFSLWWIFCWFSGSVSIRSVTIERKSEPKTYRLAMLGFLILDLAFLTFLLLSLHTLHTHAA